MNVDDQIGDLRDLIDKQNTRIIQLEVASLSTTDIQVSVDVDARYITAVHIDTDIKMSDTYLSSYIMEARTLVEKLQERMEDLQQYYEEKINES